MVIDERSDTPDTHNADKPMDFGAVLVLSFIIFNTGFVIAQTLRWTNPLAGLANGLFHSIVWSVVWLMLMLPWSLGVYFFYSKKLDIRHRAQCILAPAWLMLILSLGSLILQPPTAQKRFERLANLKFPTPVEDLNTNFMGGGLADFSDTYYFKTSSSEIERIIKEKQMVEDEPFGKFGLFSTIIKPLKGSPDFKNWEGVKQYRWMDERHHWFCNLITDSSKTQAYIFVGCT